MGASKGGGDGAGWICWAAAARGTRLIKGRLVPRAINSLESFNSMASNLHITNRSIDSIKGTL